MKTTILILAAGPARKGWTNANPKQLAYVQGKPLIVRTIDQLNKRGYTNDVVVVTKYKRIKEVSPRYFIPAKNYWRTETILSTQELWDERTIIIHGDTIFSDVAMDAIVAEPGPLMFIGIDDMLHAEAFIFTAEAQAKVKRAAKVASKMAYMGKAAPLSPKYPRLDSGYQQGCFFMHWAFYRELSGWPIEDLYENAYNPLIHKMISHDYTCDIDTPEQHAQFLARHKWARSR